MPRMPVVYAPIRSAEQWKALLADPDRHWRTGYSAKALAHCWLSASGLPTELSLLFATSGFPHFRTVRPLLVIPEHSVPLPPRSTHPSQNDVFVLAKAADSALISIAVEGKVSESFDRTLRGWMKPMSEGKRTRLRTIEKTLGIAQGIPHYVRYQLLHRLASAVIEAERFSAKYAVMVIHSFSQTDAWFRDFAAFLAIFGQESKVGELKQLTTVGSVSVYAGWCRGEERFLAA